MKPFKYKETITFNDKLLGPIQGQYLGDATVTTFRGVVVETIFTAVPRDVAQRAQEQCVNRYDQFKSLSWHVDHKSNRLNCRLAQLYSNINEHFPEEQYLFRMFRVADIAEVQPLYDINLLVEELKQEIIK